MLKQQYQPKDLLGSSIKKSHNISLQIPPKRLFFLAVGLNTASSRAGLVMKGWLIWFFNYMKCLGIKHVVRMNLPLKVESYIWNSTAVYRAIEMDCYAGSNFNQSAPYRSKHFLT